MNAKRILCLLLSLLLCLSMMGTLSLSVATAAAADEALTDNMIFVNPSWTPANLPAQYTVDGRTYDLVWGRNAYSNAQTAVDAAPEFGTVYLCAGGYITTLTVKKSLTLLGAKHGIDPNIRGANDEALWTLNPERGMGETLLQASLNLGANGNTLYDDQIKVVVDGIMIGGKGQINANNGTAGYGEFELKNIYLKNSLHTSPVFFMTSYFNGAANTFKRFVSIENMRVEGQTVTNVMTITADELDISGLYMHTDCTQPFLKVASASNGPTDEVYWNLHDSMLAAPVQNAFYFDWVTPTSNGQNMFTGLPNRSKVLINVYNNVFVDATVGFRMESQNIYPRFVGNTFYNSNATTSAKGLIYGYCLWNNRKDFSGCVTVTANRFIGDYTAAYLFQNTTVYPDISGNYSEVDGQAVAMPLLDNSHGTESWYWLDEAMTVKSTDENPGAGYGVTASQGLMQGKPVTVSDSLPDTAALVNPSWTEATVPATFTVRGKTFTLHWGVNAFADIPTADAAVRDFGTMYLCPGTYSTAHATTKNLTILGPNFGINPNVKGQNERDLWTLNPDRSAEANITASLNLSAATGVDNADFMVVDGVQLTGTGNLRSNAATIQGYAKITIKNIYIKNNNTNPLYLYPHWADTSAGANTFRRDVTIENVRVEKHTGSDGVLRLTAERADISGVYMHTDCAYLFIKSASASNGPTTEAVWNLHDNQFAAPVGRGIYLDWQNAKGDSASLATGVANRNKIVTSVYNNAFVNFYNKDAVSSANRSVASRVNTENVYVNMIGNSFYQENAIASDHQAYQFYAGSNKNYSDQVVFKNNRFIGNYASDTYFNQSTKGAVDVSGNYAVKDGVVRALVIAGDAATYAQDYYYLDALMTKKSTDTTQLKAPTAVSYKMDQPGTGRADGVVTVTLPAGHDAEDIYLFWGDENGKLEGYSALSPFMVGGNEVANRLKNGSIVPAGATRLLAYSYSDAYGLSDSFASVNLPANAAMNLADLGEPVLEFQSVGDIHVSTTTNGRIHHAQHMEAMLEDVKVNSPDTFGIFSNGDMADRGIDADYERLLEVVAGVEDAPTLYYTFGNHETFRYDLPIPSGNTLSQYQGPFYDYLGNTIPADAVFSAGGRYGSLSYTFTQNGIKFISLGTDVLDQNWLELSDATIDWLETQLATNRDPGKPVIIIMHQPMQDTNADSYNVRPATTTKLKAVLKDYPEVIMFNGHTHDSLYEDFTFYQGDEIQPNFFNCSAVGYIPVTYHGNDTSVVGAEGYYVTVYEDQVIVRGRDFLNGEWIASAQYVINMADGAGDVSRKVVSSPVSGRNTSELVLTGNTISGNVTCFMPTGHNATHLALYFADADTGILGEQPFATAELADSFAGGNMAVGFADITVPDGADYILAYGWAEAYGFSADCDVVTLADLEDMTEALANGNVSTSDKIKTDKKVYKLGEPINVYATWEKDGDWVGMQLASVTSGSFLYYHLTEATSGTAVDITKESVVTSFATHKFQQVTAGYWQIGWISADNPKQTFQTGKLAEHLITIHIVDQQCEQLGLPVAPAARIGDVVYPSFDKALAAVTDGQTITLEKDAVTKNLVVEPGITLDLNGYGLTANYVVGLNTSDVINSAETADGKILVAKDKLTLSKDNADLPVYDEAAGAYLFTRVKNDRFAVTEVGGKPKYSTSPMFKEYAHPLMDTAAKAATSGVDVIIRLTWTDSEGQYVGTQDYTYLDSSIAEVMASYVNENGEVNYSKQFYGIFVGSEIESGVDVTVTTVVKSETGVEMESAKTTLFA